MHSLKIISLISWTALLAFQVTLPWMTDPQGNYWLLALAIPLLIPLRGLLRNQRYTYKWIGFLTLFYFCIGVSELVSNSQLRIYGFGTSVASMLLFLASIYFARYLGLQRRN
ncbi:MAG: DUF2069 domain-containing protein [Gammaproteobacteria bacterium]|jgi:uncharacterized membrane protein|nr:DUF2069 domain-containing protein [Gammaproteobacteria bacterium]